MTVSNNPITTSHQPWSPADRAAWLASRVKQRSYADEVLSRIELLGYRFDAQEYGRLDTLVNIFHCWH